MDNPFAAKFDARAKVFATQADLGQFDANTYTTLIQFADSLNQARSCISIWDKAPPRDEMGWRLTFDAYNFASLDFEGKKCSRLELATIASAWIPRKKPDIPYYALLGARRSYPVVYKESHLRERIRERIKGDSTPEQKFVNMDHDIVVQFAALFLEAARRKILFRTFPSKIAIPTKRALLIGSIEKGKIADASLPLAIAQYSTAEEPISDPPRDCDYHVVVRTEIDYDGLNTNKEKIYEQMGPLGKDTRIEDAAGVLTSQFFGINPAQNWATSERVSNAVAANLKTWFGDDAETQKRLMATFFSRETIEAGIRPLVDIAERAFMRLGY